MVAHFARQGLSPQGQCKPADATELTIETRCRFGTKNLTMLKLLTQENVLVGGFFVISGYAAASDRICNVGLRIILQLFWPSFSIAGVRVHFHEAWRAQSGGEEASQPGALLLAEGLPHCLCQNTES